MIVDRAKVSIEVHGYGWLGFEAAILPNEDPIECMNQLKKLVESCSHVDYSMKGTVVVPAAYAEVNETIDRVTGLIEAVSCCTTITALERFKPMVDREKSDLLNDMYNKKKQQLQ